MELGKKLREERIAKRIRLREISKSSGLSKSFISQIEKGKANPSVASLKRITDSLKIPLASLFDDSSVKENGYKVDQGEVVLVVKRERRKRMKMPGSEIEYFLLSPDLKRKIEFLLTVVDPGVSSGEDFFSHEGEECGVVLKGRIEFTVRGEKYTMNEGDSIYFSSSLPHSWRNIGDDPAELIWAITPPSF